MLFPLGVEALVESVDLVRAGTAPRIVQDESEATYEGWCKAQDVAIDWTAPTSTVFNMIRGADPQPGANTTFNGKKVSLYNTSLSANVPENPSDSDAGPGAVLAIGEPEIAISTKDGSINVGRVREAGGKKIDAAEWAGAVGLKVGDVFGS